MAKECEYLYREKAGWFSYEYNCTRIHKKVSYEYFDEYCSEWKHDECNYYKDCYIATMLCKVIDKEKTKETFKSLQYLRYDVMDCEKYKETLSLYDIVGPIIVDKLIYEPIKDKNGNKLDKKQVYINLYNLCIEKVSNLVIEKKYEEAINLYKNMVNLLVQGYDIRKQDNENSKEYKLAILK